MSDINESAVIFQQGMRDLTGGIQNLKDRSANKKAAEEFSEAFKKTPDGQTEMGQAAAVGIKTGALSSEGVYASFAQMPLDKLYPMIMRDAFMSGDPKRIAVANASTATLKTYLSLKADAEESVKFGYDAKRLALTAAYSRRIKKGDGGDGGGKKGGGKTHENIPEADGLNYWNFLKDTTSSISVPVDSGVSFEYKIGENEKSLLAQVNDFYNKNAQEGVDVDQYREAIINGVQSQMQSKTESFLKNTNPAYANDEAKPYLEKDAKILASQLLYSGKDALIAIDDDSNIKGRSITLGQMPDYLFEQPVPKDEDMDAPFEEKLKIVETIWRRGNSVIPDHMSRLPDINLKTKKLIRKNPEEIDNFLIEAQKIEDKINMKLKADKHGTIGPKAKGWKPF